MKIGNLEIKFSLLALGIVETLANGAKKISFLQFKDGALVNETWIEGGVR